MLISVRCLVQINTKKLLGNKIIKKLILFSTPLYISWVLFIALLTLVPGKVIPNVNWDFLSFDKLIHFSIFSLMAFLGGLSFNRSNRFQKGYKSILVSLFVAILYGIVLEYSQTYIPDRGFDYADMTANITGSVTGMVLFLFFENRTAKYRQS
jgi:VanZ like protein